MGNAGQQHLLSGEKAVTYNPVRKEFAVMDTILKNKVLLFTFFSPGLLLVTGLFFAYKVKQYGCRVAAIKQCTLYFG